MATIFDNAHFNRASLLGSELTDEMSRLEHPGDDYVVAGKMVWSALRSQSIKQSNPEDIMSEWDGNRSDRLGRTVEGMGPFQAFDLLWPHLPKSDRQRNVNAIRNFLRESDNAHCIVQGRYHALAQWWVADQWNDTPVTRKRTVQAKPRRKANKLKRTATPESNVFPQGFAETALLNEAIASVALDGDTRSFEEGAHTSVAPKRVGATSREDALHSLDVAMAKVRNYAIGLEAENRELKERLEKITSAISGL
jgi:hypothetical protein